nr:MAG TPA: hypothetical protein [Caudoviricetes sp.]
MWRAIYLLVCNGKFIHKVKNFLRVCLIDTPFSNCEEYMYVRI